jgi:hypothetical protein
MQPRYMRNLLRLPLASQRILEREFQLPRRGSLFFRLADARVDHAKATMMLLLHNDRAGAELLLGHQIVICPPCLSRRFAQSYRARTPDEDKIITKLGPNPHPHGQRSAERLETAFDRYAKLRVGMTIDQAIRRGVTRRDLREWAATGAITIGRKVMRRMA